MGAYAGLTAIAAGFINWWYWATHPETTDPTPPKVGSRPIEVKPGPPPTRPVPAACLGK